MLKFQTYEDALKSVIEADNAWFKDPPRIMCFKRGEWIVLRQHDKVPQGYRVSKCTLPTPQFLLPDGNVIHTIYGPDSLDEQASIRRHFDFTA